MKLQHFRTAPEESRPGTPEPFNLSLPFEQGWREAPLRCLVVLETVPSADLRTGALLSPGRSRDLVLATLKLAVSTAKRYARSPTPSMDGHGHRSPKEVGSWRFGFINFNDRRWLGLDPASQERLARAAAVRVTEYVRRTKPDLVIVAGSVAARELTLLGASAARNYGRLTTITGTDVPAVATLDITSVEPSRDDADMGGSGDATIVKPNILGHAIRNMVTGLLGVHPHSVGGIALNPAMVTDADGAADLIKRAMDAPAVALDLETTSLDTSDVRVLTVQIATDPGTGHIIPIHHQDAPWRPKELRRIQSLMRRWLGARTRPWDVSRYIVGQNIGYDMRVLTKWLSIRHWHLPVWDLMAGEHLLDENIKLLRRFGADSIHGLEQICAYYDSTHYQEAAFSKSDRVTIADVELAPGAPVLDYMAADVQLPFAIHEEQMRRADRIPHGDGGDSYGPDFRRAMLSVMSPMVKSAMIMRYRGTQVDAEYLLKVMAGTEDLARLAKRRLDELHATPEARKAEAILRKRGGLAKGGFFGSDGGRALDVGRQEHRELLFLDIAGLEPLKKGRSGRPSFDRKFQEAHSDVPLVKAFRDYGELRQLEASFIRPFSRLMQERPDNRHDGRIHPEFGITATWTGRSNSYDPSLQQIPEHKDSAAYVKRMLVTSPGHLHYEIDYSQFEVRCLALLSRDRAMIEMLDRIHAVVLAHRVEQTAESAERKALEGDFHKSNYAFFTGTPIERVDKAMRQANKGIIFGIMYGMGDESLGRATNRSTKEAGRLRAQFYARYPEAEKYLKRQVSLGQERLHTSSPLGRRRNLFAYLSTMRALRGGQDRRTQNSEIQGLASDLCWKSSALFACNLNRVMARLDPDLARSPFEKGGAAVPNDRYLPFGSNAIVHDSNKGEADLDHFLLHLHVLEHSMTKGLVRLVEREFGWRIDVPLDVELDVGSGWAGKRTWDGTEAGLDEVILASLESHREMRGKGSVPKPRKALRRMKDAYRRQRDSLNLDKRMPLPHPLPID